MPTAITVPMYVLQVPLKTQDSELLKFSSKKKKRLIDGMNEW